MGRKWCVLFDRRRTSRGYGVTSENRSIRDHVKDGKDLHLFEMLGKGNCFGYRYGDNLWTQDGSHIGKFYADEVYDSNGKYLGEIKNNNKLITHSSKNSRQSGFTPYISRVGHVSRVDNVGNIMIAGYENFPKL